MYDHLIIIILLSTLAGFIGAISGGGGIITLPLIIMSGEPPVNAIGENKMLAVMTTMTSASYFLSKRSFDFNCWRLCIICTILGCILGVNAVSFIPTRTLNCIIPLFVCFAAMFSTVNWRRVANENTLINKKVNKITIILIGLTLGFYGGCIGTGIGMFWTFVVARKFEVDIIYASMTSRIMCFITNATALSAFILTTRINFHTGFLMGACMSVGSYFGARSAIYFGKEFINSITILLTMIMCFETFV